MDKTFYCLLGALTATAAATVAVISTYDAPAPQQDGDSSARVRMIWQLRTRANSLIESQNYPVALLVLNRLSRLEPGNASFQRLLVRVLYETGRNDDAILICRKLLAGNPDNATSRNNLGVLLTASGSFEAGIKELQKAHSLAPDNEFIDYNLSRAYQALGNLPEARICFARASRNRKQMLTVAPLTSSPFPARNGGRRKNPRRTPHHEQDQSDG
ncbi:MAG: tetratricopeptide repeat protein [Lentisphaeria bacterium]|nr:MAG: tetratricopeptide repeat protein [Lentisphaeria bacterium]